MDNEIKPQNVWTDIRKQDTSDSVRKKQSEIWQRLSDEQRFTYSLEMMDMARDQIMDNIKSEQQDISEIDLKVLTFRRMYKSDFNANEMEEICNWFKQVHKLKTQA